MRLRIVGFLDRNHWVLPLVCTLGAIALAFGTLAIDRRFDDSLIPERITGTPVAAQSLLSTTVTAMVTLMTLVLTIMTVAVQLAMEQFSPRIVQALLRDRGNKLSLGLFGGAAAYAFITVTAIDDQHNRVPGLTVVTSYLLTIASLVALILYVSRSGQALRAAGLIDLVGDHLHSEIEKLPRLAERTQYGSTELVVATEPGVVVAIDAEHLVHLARKAEVVIELCVMMGDFVPTGGPLAAIRGAGPVDHRRVLRAVLLGPERTHNDDPVFALTKLVEISSPARRPSVAGHSSGSSGSSTGRPNTGSATGSVSLMCKASVPAGTSPTTAAPEAGQATAGIGASLSRRSSRILRSTRETCI